MQQPDKRNAFLHLPLMASATLMKLLPYIKDYPDSAALMAQRPYTKDQPHGAATTSLLPYTADYNLRSQNRCRTYTNSISLIFDQLHLYSCLQGHVNCFFIMASREIDCFGCRFAGSLEQMFKRKMHSKNYSKKFNYEPRHEVF